MSGADASSPPSRLSDAGWLPPWLSGIALSRGRLVAAYADRVSDAGSIDPVCSAKGCTAPAQYQLLWNNPKIHTPDRRKTWLACDEHEEHLRTFLSARGFWKATEPFSPSP